MSSAHEADEQTVYDGRPSLSFESLSNPISGANEHVLGVESDLLDFGEFHDGAADVHANSRMNATCGNLSKKYVLRMYSVLMTNS